MNRKIALFILFFLAAIVQVSLAPVIFFYGVAPDVVLIILVSWLAKNKAENFWGWIVSAGIILDVLTFSPIGIHVISFTVVGFTISSIAKRFFVIEKVSAFSPTLILVIGSTILNLAFVSLESQLAEYAGIFEYMPLTQAFSPVKIFFLLLNNSLVFMLIYWLTLKFKKFFLIGENKLTVK